MSEKQTADAVNNYVLNDDMLDELRYFRHKKSMNIRATCTYNTCDKDIHSRDLKIENYKPMKLNPGLPWQKLHSARRRFFLPANWT